MKLKLIVFVALYATSLTSYARQVPKILITPDNQKTNGINVEVHDSMILHQPQEMLTFRITCPESQPEQDFRGIDIRLSNETHVIGVFSPPVVATSNMLSGEFTISQDQVPLTLVTIRYSKKFYPRPDNNPDKIFVLDLKAFAKEHNKNPNKRLQAIGDKSPQPDP
jgi:hypothetical protein